MVLKNTLKPVALAVSAAVVMTGFMFSLGAAQAQEITPMAAAQTQQLPDFVHLVEKYGKGVVNISTVREARIIEGASPFDGLDERHAPPPARRP